MIVKGIIFEDFVNYKEPAMVLEFPKCSFKCGNHICQNEQLAQEKNIEVDDAQLIERYKRNPITSSIVCQGLEPLDSFPELMYFLDLLRNTYKIHDDFVIYTGYKFEECKDRIAALKQYENIIVKYGRYIPEQEKHYDDVLGVYLASDNQYAEKIS